MQIPLRRRRGCARVAAASRAFGLLAASARNIADSWCERPFERGVLRDFVGVDYISKPIVPGELLARIRVYLANARMAHSARTALDAFGRFPARGKSHGPCSLVYAAGGKTAWRRVHEFRPGGLRPAARRPSLAAPVRRRAAWCGTGILQFEGPQFVARNAAHLYRADRAGRVSSAAPTR